jgi:hypothetical protein
VGLEIEEHFGDWTRSPLTDASAEIITIAWTGVSERTLLQKSARFAAQGMRRPFQPDDPVRTTPGDGCGRPRPAGCHSR